MYYSTNAHNKTDLYTENCSSEVEGPVQGHSATSSNIRNPQSVTHSPQHPLPMYYIIPS